MATNKYLKIIHIQRYLKFQLGRLIFLLLDPIFKYWENRDADVRFYFRRGLNCLDRGEIAISLLNLNMVLSLKPNHFLALISRGRLYLKENRCQLATRDFLNAKSLNTYRFTHYDSKGDYFRLLNKANVNLDLFVVSNFTEVAELLSKLRVSPTELDSSSTDPLSREHSQESQECYGNNEYMPAYKKLAINKQDHYQFNQLGPISQEEIDSTDWDQLIHNFTS